MSTITVTAPEVAYPGPNDTQSGLMRRAADNIKRGYPLGGSNLTEAVVLLLGRVSDAMASQSDHPMIVLDPSEFDVAWVCDTLRGHDRHGVSYVADRIEEQTKPARIPEPIWSKKVTAHSVMNKVRRSFVRWQDGSEKVHSWADHEGIYDWDELIDPVLLTHEESP